MFIYKTCYFQSYIADEDKKNFFTKLKHQYGKERHLNLKSFEIRKAMHDKMYFLLTSYQLQQENGIR